MAHIIPPSVYRAAVLGRRVSVSPEVAAVMVSIAFGTRERDHAEALHFATHARVVDAMEAR